MVIDDGLGLEVVVAEWIQVKEEEEKKKEMVGSEKKSEIFWAVEIKV